MDTSHQESPPNHSFPTMQADEDLPMVSSLKISAIRHQSSTTDQSEGSTDSPGSLTSSDCSDDQEEDSLSILSTDYSSSTESLTCTQPSGDPRIDSTAGASAVGLQSPTTDPSEGIAEGISGGSSNLKHGSRAEKLLSIPAGKKTSVRDTKETRTVKEEQPQVRSIVSQSPEKRINAVAKPRVFTRTDVAPKIIHHEKNFVKAALDKKLVRTEPKPAHVDWGGRRSVTGDSENVPKITRTIGGLPNYLKRHQTRDQQCCTDRGDSLPAGPDEKHPSNRLLASRDRAPPNRIRPAEKAANNGIAARGPAQYEGATKLAPEKRIHVITKPRVFTRADAAPMIVRREKDFVKAALDKKLVKTEPRPAYVDWSGRRNVVGQSTKYTQKNNYGRVPDYLLQRYRSKSDQEK